MRDLVAHVLRSGDLSFEFLSAGRPVDAYGYLLVATGRAEIMVDPIMNLWDAAAIAPIVEGAGGTFTDWQGKATVHTGDGVATNGLVHEPVLKLLTGPP